MSEKDKTFNRDSKNVEWIAEETEAELNRLQKKFGQGIFFGSDLKDGETSNITMKDEDTTDIAIDVASGERVPPETIIAVADNQEADDSEGAETTETVVLEANNEADGLTTNQILLAILNSLNTRNKLAQETNKRLRDQNKILRKMAGLTAPTNRTLQGTPPPKQNRNLYDQTENSSSSSSTKHGEPLKFPE